MSFDPENLVVPGVLSLQPYQPGKNIEELERELGISGIVKLASNENPRAPSASVGRAVTHMLPELSRYPDGGGFHLKQALADQLAVDPGPTGPRCDRGSAFLCGLYLGSKIGWC